MKRSEVFPSKYLKAEDLGGKALIVTIEAATREVLRSFDGKEQAKTVLSFKGATKTLPLNATNWDAVASATGEDDSDGWSGHAIEIYPTTTTMQGKAMDCIRIRRPQTKPATKPAPDDDMNDAIPF